jgi:hypothetical protein
MAGGNVNKTRLAEVAEYTDNKMMKGVCYSLLGRDAEALEVFRSEAEKRFSLIDDGLQWPAISRHHKQLYAIREELLKTRRSLGELPKV